jgi:hypothetical protein
MVIVDIASDDNSKEKLLTKSWTGGGLQKTSYSVRWTDTEERYLVNIVLWKYDIYQIKELAKERGVQFLDYLHTL